MSEVRGFRRSKQWDYRRHETSRMWFKTDNGERLDDIKRRALNMLRNVAYGDGAEPDIDGPLWALQDQCSREELKAACLWLRAAHAYSDDEEVRRKLCIEAYGKIERALRCYLS
jgi:hypothetical protein